MMKVFNDNNIEQYMHCMLCASSVPKGQSPQEWSKLSIGWTEQGLQVWCHRHNCNVMHIDFEGQQHRADMSRMKTEEELV